MPRTRRAAFAGRFYPASRSDCERMLRDMSRSAEVTGRPVGAIVPHAGWVYSGPTAAVAIGAVGAARPETVVVFGAVHVPAAAEGSLYAAGCWQTPLGDLAIDEELAERASGSEWISIDEGAHEYEHSIEVQLPLVRHFLGEVRILPIMVRPGPHAERIGRDCVAAALELGRRVVFLCSTDLTHYGPSFGFEPHGRGEAGIRWAKEVNDRRLIERIAAFDAEGVLTEAALNHSACGAGAVAAGIGAAREMGADRYVELEHTTSAEREGLPGLTTTSVGYEAGVFVASSEEVAG